MTTNVDDTTEEGFGENSTNPWVVIGDTVIGPPSKKRDTPNQDDFGYIQTHDQNHTPHVLIAVADGAGSLDLSHFGAELAVQTVLETGADCLHNTHESVDNIAHIIGATARKALNDHPDRKHLGSTLAAAIANDTDYAVTITGDAFAVIAYDDGTHRLLQNPKVGEYANITKLLTSPRVDTTVYSGSMENVIGIAVSSDGLAHSTIDNQTETPTSGFWGTVFTKTADRSLDVQAVFEYMRSVDKIDDDTTMVVAVRSH